MGYKYRQVIEYGRLRKALNGVCTGVRWKPSVSGYEHNAQRRTHQLRESLLKGTYKIDTYQEFIIHEPKTRKIVATRLKDRQFQRSLCDNVLYEQITRTFITDNCACQRGRGVLYCLHRMTCHLERYWRDRRREAGGPPLTFQADGWVLKCDIHHFFENIPHDVAIRAVRKRVSDWEAAEHVSRIINSYGERGIGLGSEVSQLVALAVLDDMDHMIKEELRIRYYIRYMDDFILIHPDKAHLQHCLARIREHLAGIGLELNTKTTLQPLRHGFVLLHWRYILTETGRVIRKIDQAKLTRERRKLRKLKGLYGQGRIGMEDVRANYRSFADNVMHGHTRQDLRKMDQYYTALIKEVPPHGKQKRNPDTGARAARCRSGARRKREQSGKGTA